MLDLPDELKRFLLKANGGVPDRRYFTLHHPARGPEERHLDHFLGIDTGPFSADRMVDCIYVLIRFRDYLPSSSIPIAFVDRDDLLLTFSAGARSGQVWLKIWNPSLDTQEDDREADLFFVADSLVGFLNLLSATERLAPPE